MVRALPDPWLTAVVEGTADRAALTRLFAWVGLPGCPTIHLTRGKNELDRKLAGLNQAARGSSWLVLRDLDRDADCAPELVRSLLPHPSPGMLLRIPVRALEAWLLADRPGMARFLGISESRIPEQPETLERPKRSLVDLARKSRKIALRKDMVPDPGLSSEVGPAYSARIIEFVSRHWDPERAAVHSESLNRCLQRLRRLTVEP